MNLNRHINRIRQRKQGGFTFVELIVVVAVIAILIILAVPKFKSFLIESKTPQAVQDTQRLITKIVTNHADGTTTPYASLNVAANAAAELAALVKDNSSVFNAVTTPGAAATTHSLGASGSAITLARGNITVAGDSATLTFATVNRSACVPLATGLQKTAERIQVNGTNIKAVGGVFNATTLAATCTDDDSNTIVFTFR
jgi:prepilin-type N-terminal cleavage/methylation domain-containing protein